MSIVIDERIYRDISEVKTRSEEITSRLASLEYEIPCLQSEEADLYDEDELIGHYLLDQEEDL